MAISDMNAIMENKNPEADKADTLDSVWPPKPLNSARSEDAVSYDHTFTKYAWLEKMLGMLLGVSFSPIFAIASVLVDENVHSSPYSALVLPIGYFVSFCLSLAVAYGLRRKYRLFGTAMLLGTVCSLFVFGLMILLLLSVPPPPS